MDRETIVNRITADLLVHCGYKIVDAMVRAMMEEMERTANVDDNGDVHVQPKTLVMRQIRFNMKYQHELRDLFIKAYPVVADQIIYEKRRQWSDQRELKREAVCQ